MANYQKQLAKSYVQRVQHREFTIGDLILRKVVKITKDLVDGKLGLNWEGQYKIIKLARKEAYNLENLEGKKVPRPWKSNKLRKFCQCLWNYFIFVQSYYT